jgi:hypothetical protein
VIPLPLLTRIPWRLVGAVGMVVAVALMGWRVSAWHEAYEALPGVKAALAREEACGEGSKCDGRQQALEAAQTLVTQKVVANYEAELEALRNRPVPTRVIRVCREARTGDVRFPSAPGGTDGTGTPGGVVSGPDEFDTRPLRELAREADELSARLRALQGWNRALSQNPPTQ